MWEFIGYIAFIGTVFGLCWVIDHGLVETASEVGKIVKAFRDALGS